MRSGSAAFAMPRPLTSNIISKKNFFIVVMRGTTSLYLVRILSAGFPFRRDTVFRRARTELRRYAYAWNPRELFAKKHQWHAAAFPGRDSMLLQQILQRSLGPVFARLHAFTPGAAPDSRGASLKVASRNAISNNRAGTQPAQAVGQHQLTATVPARLPVGWHAG